MASVSYRLDIDGGELSAQTQWHGRRTMSRLQRRTATQARQDVPVRTGNLGRQVREGDIRSVGPWQVDGSVEDHAHYALYVHEGTRPHTIQPRTAQALRFEIGGRVVFSKLVNHPGTKARPFLLNAGLRAAAEIAATS